MGHDSMLIRGCCSSTEPPTCGKESQSGSTGGVPGDSNTRAVARRELFFALPASQVEVERPTVQMASRPNERPRSMRPYGIDRVHTDGISVGMNGGAEQEKRDGYAPRSGVPVPRRGSSHPSQCRIRGCRSPGKKKQTRTAAAGASKRLTAPSTAARLASYFLDGEKDVELDRRDELGG
ncbi:hypothetical protein LX36DRAFT_339211 [Colletotrichum falcatum]|nr:hypothetical protein LX36DRAFT_339211 [Colletotrichum falcatum]